MKNLWLLFFKISLVAFVLYGCQKDEPLQLKNDSKKSLKSGIQKNGTLCDEYLGKFCEKENQLPAALVKPDGEGVGIKVGKEVYEIMPMNDYKGSKVVGVRLGKDVFVLHNIRSKYILSRSMTNKLPSQLTKILDVTFGDKNTSVDRLLNDVSLQTQREITSYNGRKIIDFTSISPQTGKPTTTFAPCDYEFHTSVDIYLDVFLEDIDVQPFVFDLVEDGFNQCPTYDGETEDTPVFDDCNFCKDPRCVLDYLMADDDAVSDFTEELIMANYIRAVYDLPDDTFEELLQGQENRDFVREMYEFSYECDQIDILYDAINDTECNQFTDSNNSFRSADEFEDCVMEAITTTLINQYGDQLTDAEITIIEQNNWLSDDLLSFMECSLYDPEDPLSPLGQLIRSFLDHQQDKDFFSLYWSGLMGICDDEEKIDGYCVFHLSDAQMDEINLYGEIDDASGMFDILIENPWGATIGRMGSADITVVEGEIVEFCNLYDFDWNYGLTFGQASHQPIITGISPIINTICGITGRSFSNEWKTRAVNIASLIESIENTVTPDPEFNPTAYWICYP